MNKLRKQLTRFWPISVLAAAFTILSSVDQLQRASIYLQFGLAHWRLLIHQFWEFIPNTVSAALKLGYVDIPSPVPEIFTLLSLLILSARARDRIVRSQPGKTIRSIAARYWECVCYPMLGKAFSFSADDSHFDSSQKLRFQNFAKTVTKSISTYPMIMLVTILLVPFVAPFSAIFYVLLFNYIIEHGPSYLYGDDGGIAFLFGLNVVLAFVVAIISVNQRFSTSRDSDEFDRKFTYMLSHVGDTLFTLPVIIIFWAILIVLFASGLELLANGAVWFIEHSQSRA